MFNSFDHVSSSQTVNKFTAFVLVKVLSSLIKQFPLNFTHSLSLYITVSFGANLLPDMTEVVIHSSENASDFHANILSEQLKI